MSEYRLYITTVQSKKDAKQISEALLKYQAAACVNIIEKITSVYMWENKVCTDDECLLIIKSKAELFEKIKKIVLTLHKYDLPELIEIPITNGFRDYLGWIDESTRL
ncbi:divalent-cation tolerance protein CutA [bacterium]|nr:divalent-cation tolerance protein CutA [bacterium]